MSQDTEFLRACFTTPDGQVNVHFNPATLQYTLTNTMQQRGGGKKQYVSGSTGKLAMDLVFDTTHDGTDVRIETAKLSKLMKPGTDKLVPKVTFEWGLYKFEGTMETYKETLDFFSPNGVPLRASLSLGLAATEEQVFARGTTGAADTFTTSGDLALDTVVLPAADTDTGGGAGGGTGAGGGAAGSPQDVATRGGNPGGARLLAAANGAESLRASASAGLAVSASITLSPPVAFASGGAGGKFGIGAGAGIGISGGASAGLGIGGGAAAGFGLSGGASAGLGIGGGAAAGFGLSGGASAGLGIGGGAAAGFGLSGGGAAGIGLSGGAAGGIGLSAGAGAGIGFGGGASGGMGISAGAAAGIGITGGAAAFSSGSAGGIVGGAGFRVGSASAGVTASGGAFAGLRPTTRVTRTASFRVERLLPDPGAAHLATGGGARFAVGGRALVEGGGSLRADVGATATLGGRVSFDGEG